MQVNGPLPFHIANAYGVQRPNAAPPATAAPPAKAPESAGPTAPLKFAQPADRVQITGPATATNHTGAINELVAGQVRDGIDFDGPTPSANSVPTLQLYTRAADKLNAAVAVQVGRTVDLRG